MCQKSVKKKKLHKVQMLTRISTNFMSESVTISGDTRGKYIGDFMHRDRGEGGGNISLVCYVRTLSWRMRMLLFTFFLRRIYIPHLYHYILLALTCNPNSI